jgi:D-cysteine desulfhydrase
MLCRYSIYIYQYGRLGSIKLVDGVCDYLQFKAKQNPYAIPVGGSNTLGSWGYINGVDELMAQMRSISSECTLDHVVFASGSGGTAAGIVLGLALAHEHNGKTPPKVHAVGVCDSPSFFYNTITTMADGMGISLDSDTTTEQFVRNSVIVHQGKGQGYASSTDEELDFILLFSLETGISLDPVYSGKALYHFLKKVVEDDPEAYRDKSILFWHTGGALGIYDKGDDLLVRFNDVSPVKRINVYGEKEGDDVVDLS